jgi:DNA-binding beta-propeller fold protein YncE
MRSSALRAAPVLAALFGACAHAPAPAAPVQASWPPGPLPRARWVRSLPAAGSAEPSFWGRAAQVVLGTEASEAHGPALRRPMGVAVVPGGLAVADPDAPGVFRISEAGALSEVLCAGREWSSPQAVAASGATFYVADATAAAVVRVEAGGACLAFGEQSLARPVGLAAANGRIYVVDGSAHAVVVFSPDGRELFRFGERGDSGAGLNFPLAVAAAPDGALLVVDALNFRVARFGPDGAYRSALGGTPDGVQGLPRPKGVAVAEDGRVMVSDAERDAVLVFHPDGVLDFVLGGSGNGPADLAMPAGLALAGPLLYAADAMNGRIQVFELLGDTR